MYHSDHINFIPALRYLLNLVITQLVHLYFTMEDLPDALIGEIVKRVSSTSDLSSLSLVSKRLYKIEAESRHTIHISCSLRPATDAIVSLCS